MAEETEQQRSKRRRQRTLFDGVAQLYEATRPGYPAEIVEFLAATAGAGPGSSVLEQRLSEALGEQVWHDSGLGVTPPRSARRSLILSSRPSTCASCSKNATRTSPLRGAANRELMAQLNTAIRPGDTPHEIIAPHPSHTLTVLHQPLSCANARIRPRRMR
jgi:hypothetical protein